MDFVFEEITEIGDKEILKHRKQVFEDNPTYSDLAINVPAKKGCFIPNVGFDPTSDRYFDRIWSSLSEFATGGSLRI